jgi:hypothetical protein
MPAVPLILAAISVIAINIYGWRVIPDEARIAFRWFIFGSRETTGKKVGLVLWFLPEFFILVGLAAWDDTDDPAFRWVGVGLLVFLLVQHFFAARRLRPLDSL